MIEHGSIGKGLKSGLMTYGLGQLLEVLGWSRNIQQGWQNPFR